MSDQAAAELPWLTVTQMIEVDRAMVEDYGIVLLQMMELAGRHLAHLARARFLGDTPGRRRVVVLAGPGGNGGGALVCARRLAGWGMDVSVFVTAAADRFSEVPRHQLDIVARLGLDVHDTDDPLPEPPDLVIDGIIGYSLRGAPRGRTAELIRWANRGTAPVLALDVPSGLDATTGAPTDPCVRATATMTLALPKQGLGAERATGPVGQLYLADIGVPPELYARPPLGVRIPDVFAGSDVVRLR
ncbi:MAG TPA: NAD(P)H-hydrate epimerase [Gemmatimonadaceae bacterium]|nr:NAD(P)H-hydrate epimerase [Gemmatimonadaceae bacterium]